MDVLTSILVPMLGGLGLFLYGMSIMSAGLEKLAGKNLEKLIGKLSGSVFRGILIGALVTAVIQSSSATTVMVVGFVNAGIMTLTQAVGIIMGANIGTTITAQMVTINVAGIAPLGIALGAFLKLFSKNSRTKVLGETILGLSLLFFGMKVMSNSIAPVRDLPIVANFMANIGSGGFVQVTLGFLIGAGFTALVQSSSATTGLMVALVGSGVMPLEAAFPILMGTNVGTCVTALISSVGANNTAKRAALIHLLFNVIGTLVFLSFLSSITLQVVRSISSDPANQLANTHTLFNVFNTILLFPFARLLVKASNKIIPITQEEIEASKYERVMFLDERILSTPKIAMAQVNKEVYHMADVAKASLKSAVEGLMGGDRNVVNRTFKLEKNINDMEREISDYLIKLSNASVDNEDRTSVDLLFNTINDLERVGDHAENIAELAIQKIDENVDFTEVAVKELNEMIDTVLQAYDYAVEAMMKHDLDLAQKVVEMEGKVDDMEKVLRKNHITRLNEGNCNTNAGIVFLDFLSNLERVSDHASNIALAVLGV